MVVPPGQLHAKTVYVRDWIVINIRSAPNDASATVAYANTEDQLELTEEADGWSKVRTGDGKEGWVGTRFLTDKPPKGVLFLSLIHISEPTRLLSISYAVFCLKKKNYH